MDSEGHYTDSQTTKSFVYVVTIGVHAKNPRGAKIWWGGAFFNSLGSRE